MWQHRFIQRKGLASVFFKAMRLTGHKVIKGTRRMHFAILKISRISAAASPKRKRKAGTVEMVSSSASASDALFRENLGTTFQINTILRKAWWRLTAFSAEGTRRLVRTGENNEEAFTMNNSELCDNIFNKKLKFCPRTRKHQPESSML